MGYAELNELSRWLRTHPDAGAVVVRGHTGIEGDGESEAVLAKSRADTVVAYLVSQGVDAKRLDRAGRGQMTDASKVGKLLPKTADGSQPEPMMETT